MVLTNRNSFLQWFLLAFFLIILTPGKAQSDSLLNAVRGGEISGYWRTFFMATDNEGELQDWNALATGGLLKYETGSYRNFSVGVGFHHITNTGISDVWKVDETTQKVSRYEVGLFDVQNPGKNHINLLTDLTLNYHRNNHRVSVGRFKMKTPFLNGQDGRMMPTMEQGIWYQFIPKNKLNIQLAWITHIAARSTSEFLRVENSMGSYPTGKNPDGSRSGYQNAISSGGLGVLGMTYKRPKAGIQFWNYYVDNVFNAAFAEPWILLHKRKESSHKLAFQYFNQYQLNDGGNPNSEQTYVSDQWAHVFGLRYLVKTSGKVQFSANWNRITGDGRYLFPREWGREFLFVFQKRERLEGFSNTHAWMVDASKKWIVQKQRLVTLKVGYGQYYRPDVRETAANKYGFPANDQLNLDVFYYSRKDKSGLSLEALVSMKRALGETYDNAGFIINKVNMVNYNLVMNYRF